MEKLGQEEDTASNALLVVMSGEVAEGDLGGTQKGYIAAVPCMFVIMSFVIMSCCGKQQGSCYKKTPHRIST